MATVRNNQAVLHHPAYLAHSGIVGDRKKPNCDVIGDRRHAVRDTKKQPKEEKKRTYMVSSGVPFELDMKYIPIKVLGMGAYGVVCSCINQKTGEKVAIKKISDTLRERVYALRTLREIQILRQVFHPNVISLKDVMVSSSPAGKADFSHVYLVQELMDCSLLSVLKPEAKLSGDHYKIKYLLFQIVRGLKYLHSAEVVHRDLKPENLLLRSNCELKICDFGLSRTKYDDAQRMTEHLGTIWYEAPEILFDAAWYGNSVDVWSAGCIFAEMLGGVPIFRGRGDCLSQLMEINRVLGTQDLSFIRCAKTRKFLEELPYSAGLSFSSLYPGADPLAIDLLEKMLAFNPWRRFSAVEVLEHPYFSGLYDPLLEPPTPLSMRLRVDEYPNRVDEKTLRELIWEQMLSFHPEERTMADSITWRFLG